MGLKPGGYYRLWDQSPCRSGEVNLKDRIYWP